MNEDECTPNHNQPHGLSPSSASSEESSLDLSSGPASPDVQLLIPSLTAEYFVGLFKPSIELLDNVVAAYLLTQGKLKLLLEEISQGLPFSFPNLFHFYQSVLGIVIQSGGQSRIEYLLNLAFR